MAQTIIEELQTLVDKWQKVEDDGGSPTSAHKLAIFKADLEKAQAADKPKKKAKKAKKAKVEEVIEEVIEEVATDEEE